MKKIYLLTASILFSIVLFSQPNGPAGGFKGMSERMKIGRFYGRIIDSTNSKGVEFASVQLISNVFDTTTKQMRSDVVVAGQLTLENGDFSLEKINLMGKYRLKISAMGYTVKEMPISFNIDMEKMKAGGGLGNTDKDLGNIKIRQLATELKAVEVVSSTPTMELKLDKKVFNVEKNIVSAGGTAEDVLKQVPSVSVDLDGNVSLRNAAPQIFVDGKPTTLTIDQIPAGAIQSIEVITNPSAKYDASGGQGGILNIVLKKDKRIGYNGNIRAGIDQRKRVNGGLDLNVREGKINVFFSGNANQRYSITNGNTERNNLIGKPLTNVYQKTYNANDGLFMHTRGGIDWFMNNRNTITLSGNYLKGKFDPTDSLNTGTDSILSNGTINSSFYNRRSTSFRNFNNIGSSIQYKHLFPKEGRELTADLNYNSTNFTGGGNYSTTYSNALQQPIGAVVLQNSKSNGGTQVISMQSDYVHPLGEKSKIEAGVMGTYRTFLSKISNYIKNDSADEYTLVKNQSTNYQFTDQIYAAYATYGIQKEKMSYQIGLRTESSFYEGELIDSNKTFKNYFPVSLFPSFSATY
ncbi:MAG TPA: outer membrane beta-barrel protein, partial [Bacteroidia bacterium]|nr:outer membrane beta-barrel protein [Bacteroidia bacterium]